MIRQQAVAAVQGQIQAGLCVGGDLIVAEVKSKLTFRSPL